MEDSDTNMMDGSMEESTEPLLEEVLEDGEADPMQGTYKVPLRDGAFRLPQNAHKTLPVDVSAPGVTEVHGPEGESELPPPDPTRGVHSVGCCGRA